MPVPSAQMYGSFIQELKWIPWQILNKLADLHFRIFPEYQYTSDSIAGKLNAKQYSFGMMNACLFSSYYIAHSPAWAKFYGLVR